MPTTPGCHLSLASTMASSRASAPDDSMMATASSQACCCKFWRCRFHSSRTSARERACPSSSAMRSSTPKEASPTRPAALSLGARVKETCPTLSVWALRFAAACKARIPAFSPIQCLEPAFGHFGGREKLEPVAHENVVLIPQGNNVGHRAQRHQVQVLFEVRQRRRKPALMQAPSEGGDELERDPDSAESSKGIFHNPSGGDSG